MFPQRDLQEVISAVKTSELNFELAMEILVATDSSLNAAQKPPTANNNQSPTQLSSNNNSSNTADGSNVKTTPKDDAKDECTRDISSKEEEYEPELQNQVSQVWTRLYYSIADFGHRSDAEREGYRSNDSKMQWRF